MQAFWLHHQTTLQYRTFILQQNHATQNQEIYVWLLAIYSNVNAYSLGSTVYSIGVATPRSTLNTLEAGSTEESKNITK